MFTLFEIFFFMIGFIFPFILYYQYSKAHSDQAEYEENKREYERRKYLASLSGHSFEIDEKYEADS